MRRSLAVVALVAVGCSPELGECDEAASLEIVYDPAGTPAFAGQALMIRGCGGGAFCHSEDIELDDRFGAPLALDFDLRLASTDGQANIEGIDRLARHQLATVRERGLVWEQVHRGLMPPEGSIGEEGFAETGAIYDRVDSDGVTFTRLPDLDDEGSRDVLRNWLACGAPVIERSQPRDDRLASDVGFEVAPCERDCVDLTWPALHEAVIVPGCATASCHDAEEPAAELDLSGDPAAAHGAILDAPPGGTACVDVGMSLLTASDPTMSLLYAKVAPGEPPCGSAMPLSGNPLSEQRLCALNAWIECGACPEADGGDCAGCLEMRRMECGVTLVGGAAECIEQAPCEGFAPPPS